MTDATNARELPSLAARRRSLFWRIHFWAALIASPFALMAALTGILYIFTPQVEQVLYAHLDRVQPVGVAHPLDETINAARSAVPAGSALRFVVPALHPTDSVKVFFTLPEPGVMDMSDDEHAAHRGMTMPTNAKKNSPADMRRSTSIRTPMSYSACMRTMNDSAHGAKNCIRRYCRATAGAG